MKKYRWIGWAVVAAAVLCCGQMVFLPKAYARWSDERLIEVCRPRPQVEGMLDEQAQDIPILYALYRRRCLVDEFYEIEQERMDRQTMTEENRNRLNDLVKTGVLPQTYVQLFDEFFAGSVEHVESFENRTGFYTMYYRPHKPEWKETGMGFTIEWHEKTNKVVSISSSLLEIDIDAEALLESYQSYLGIQQFDDWIHPAENTAQQAACWSPKGQILLYCVESGLEFRMGALSLPEKEIGKYFAFEE